MPHCSNILFMAILLLVSDDITVQLLLVRERKINSITIISIKTHLMQPQSVHLLLFCKVGYQTWFLSTGILKTKDSNGKDIQTTKQAMRLVHRHICASAYLHMEMSSLQIQVNDVLLLSIHYELSAIKIWPQVVSQCSDLPNPAVLLCRLRSHSLTKLQRIFNLVKTTHSGSLMVQEMAQTKVIFLKTLLECR